MTPTHTALIILILIGLGWVTLQLVRLAQLAWHLTVDEYRARKESRRNIEIACRRYMEGQL